MGKTKLKLLELIIKNRCNSFDVLQIELIKTFPEMSWDDLKDYIALLKQEGYVQTLYADDDLIDVRISPGTKAKLQDMFETTENEKIKSLLKNILGLFKISLV